MDIKDAPIPLRVGDMSLFVAAQGYVLSLGRALLRGGGRV